MNGPHLATLQSLTWLTQCGKDLLRRSGVVLVGLALVAVVGTIWRMRAVALEDAQRETAGLAFVLAEQTTRSLQAINIVLQDLTEKIPEMVAGKSIEPATATIGTEQIHKLLRDRLSQLPQVQAIAVIDASGKLVATSRLWPAPPVDTADRDYYQWLRDHDTREPVISEPVLNRISGEWTVFLARRMDSSDGRFLGIVAGAIEISYLESIFNSIDLPGRETFLLLRQDGTVLVRYPDERRRAGEKLPASSPWLEASRKGVGYFVSRDDFDGERRIVSTRPIRDYPLVINVSVTENAILAAWWRDAMLLGLATVVVITCALFLQYDNRRQLRRLQRSEASLTRRNEELAHLSAKLKVSEARLSQKSRQLQMTLSTMDQGLMLIDSTGHVVMCNNRALELLQLPAELMSSCPAFADVLDYDWRNNLLREGKESFEDFVRSRTILDRPQARELLRPNGRVLEVRNVPLNDGGAVRTYTDITERKACEERSLYFARHDDLTRLPNRLAFKERLEHAVAMARNDHRGLALFYLDLDRFKQVNDTRGHKVGDVLLIEAARRMQAAVRSIDTVARIGGDEFTIILPYLEEQNDTARLAERIIDSLNDPFVIDNVASTIGCSIGVAFLPQHGLTPEALMLSADKALYEAKHIGRNAFRFSKDDPGPIGASDTIVNVPQPVPSTAA